MMRNIENVDILAERVAAEPDEAWQRVEDLLAVLRCTELYMKPDARLVHQMGRSHETNGVPTLAAISLSLADMGYHVVLMGRDPLAGPYQEQVQRWENMFAQRPGAAYSTAQPSRASVEAMFGDSGARPWAVLVQTALGGSRVFYDSGPDLFDKLAADGTPHDWLGTVMTAGSVSLLAVRPNT